MDLEKEIEVLKERIKLLETFQELKKKVEELEKENSKQVYIPYPIYPKPWNPQPYYPYWTWTTSGSI